MNGQFPIKITESKLPRSMTILHIILVLFFHDFIQQTFIENLKTVTSTTPGAVDTAIIIRDKNPWP